MRYLATEAGGPGTATAVRCWHVQSSAVAVEPGPVLSRPGYRAEGWYVAPPRSTVMAALTDCGEYPEVLLGTRLRHVDPARFLVPWWFRATFRASGSGRTAIRCTGVIPKADLWCNGTLVAGASDIAGAYVVAEYDVTHLVRRGDNAVALLVHPGNPMEDLSIGWVDWNAWPPDHNMGPWRDVLLVRTGEVTLGPPQVTSRLSGDRAELRVTVEVRNLAEHQRSVTMAGVINGPAGRPLARIGRELVLGPGAEETVAFCPPDSSGLALEEPALWWPAGEGEQPLYDLQLSATCAGVLSDQAATTFGIRTVESQVAPGGGRLFAVNGRPLQIRGGGWSPDIFLRHDPQRLADELAYARHLGLNTIRPEGKLENPQFYDLADQLGLLVLPGWECCDKWEAWAGTGGAPWDEHDYEVARRSMASEAVLLRNHPSVIAFLIGSDYAPPPRLAQVYVDALEAARWPLPIVASATDEGTGPTGPSGMKMTGPYDWVPPVYWYDRDPTRGGAVGFNSETSPGHSVPRLPSLRAMLSGEELADLWQDPGRRQFHSGPPSVFDNLAVFDRALAGRYGPPASLDDYVRKAQLANYEMTRAVFEAYGGRAGEAEPATGVVYWMLNNAWPSLNWHLYDWFLDPGGAYFGAKKANEPVHVQYAYDTGEVVVVNRTAEAVGPLPVSVRVRRLDGNVVREVVESCGLLGPGATVSVLSVDRPEGVSGTYFLELELGPASRNVYWLSTTEDVLDWAATTWQYTPTCSYADLRGLEALPAARVEAAARSARAEDGTVVVTVRLRNAAAEPAGPPAVGVHASVVSSRSLEAATPILWSDNDLTLFASQSATIEGRYAASSLQGSLPLVRVDGFNLHSPVVVPG